MPEAGGGWPGERPIDPLEIKSAQDFAAALKLLRDRAGLSIRSLAKELEAEFGEAVPASTLGGWFSGSHLPTLKLSIVLPHLLRVCGEDDPVVVGQWLQVLSAVRRMPGPRPGGEVAPFRGLAFFEPEHARFFCGRAAMSAELADLVSKAALVGTPAVVVGPSGSGKSSLLRAGMVPRLSDRYEYLILKPGAQPLNVLAREVATLLGGRADDFKQVLRTDPEEFGQLVLRSMESGDAGAGAEPRGLLIVVDQLEEIFTQCSDEAQRKNVVDALCAATMAADGESRQSAAPVAVVFGLRSDFYSQALQFPRLRSALQRTQLIVGPMSRAELEEAIVGPAREAKLSFESGLVDLLLEEIAPAGIRRLSGAGHEAGALPLLSHALLATYEQATSRKLTIAQYRVTGGIHEAISRSAEDAYARLGTTALQETARQLFLRLVHTSDDAAPVRRRIQREELVGSGDAAEKVQDVVDRFIESRLLSADGPAIEITHEALLVAWGRLRDWLAADETGLRVHRNLTQVAAAWRDADRDPDLLYRGGVLEVAREWSARRPGGLRLNELEREFLEASRERHENEKLRVRRRIRQRNQVVAVLVVLVLAAVGVAAYARQLQVTADHDRANANRDNTESLSRFVADEADRLRGKDVPLAMQLALAAYRIAPTAEARSSLLTMSAITPVTRLRPASGAATALAVGRDRMLVAAGTTDGEVELWRSGEASRPVSAGVVKVSDSGVSLLGLAGVDPLLVAQGGQGPPHMWAVTDPAHPRDIGNLSGLQGTPQSLAVSADGHAIVVGTAQGEVYLWHVREPTKPTVVRPPLGRPVTAVAWAGDGRILATGGDQGTVTLWHVPDGGPPVQAGSPVGATSRIFSLAFSADGRRLAGGTGAQHDVYVWDVADQARPRAVGAPLTGPASWVNSVSFSPDGTTVAAASSDSVLWLFDVASGRPVEQLPHPNPVIGVVLGTAGTVVTLADDGMIRRWRVPGPIISGARDSIFALSFDSTGTKLGIGPGQEDNTLSVWNIADRLSPMLGTTMVNESAAGRFSGSGTLTPDARTFIVGCADGTVQIWDIGDPVHPRLVGPPFAASTGQELVEAVTISRDGKLLAVSADDGSVGLFALTDARTLRPLTRVYPPGSVKFYQAVFSPDGRLLAGAAEDGHVYVWDIRDTTGPRLVSTLGGFTAAAYSVGFGPQGDVLAAGSADNTVRVWGMADPAHPVVLGRPITGPVGYIYSLAFDQAGTTLATGSTDNTVWLWDVRHPEKPQRLATLTGPTQGVLSVAFAPDGRTLAAGGHDRTVRLWITDPEWMARWVCETAGAPITEGEWDKYVPGQPFSPPCR